MTAVASDLAGSPHGRSVSGLKSWGFKIGCWAGATGAKTRKRRTIPRSQPALAEESLPSKGNPRAFLPASKSPFPRVMKSLAIGLKWL
jgi:hypothetical protein